MAYCNTADLLLQLREERLLELASDDPTATIDDVDVVAVLDRAMDQAANRIDAIAGAHYSVPFTAPIPGLVRDLAVDLTLAALADRRDTTPAWADRRRESADKTLEQLAAGSFTLGVQPEPAANPQRQGRQQAADPVMTVAELEGF